MQEASFLRPEVVVSLLSAGSLGISDTLFVVDQHAHGQRQRDHFGVLALKLLSRFTTSFLTIPGCAHTHMPS